MKKKGYVLFINLVILTSIFGLLEIGVRLLYPEIHFPGTDKNLIKENVFESTPGLQPNSEGISNGVLKKVSGTGFWQYSTNSQDASSDSFSWRFCNYGHWS